MSLGAHRPIKPGYRDIFRVKILGFKRIVAAAVALALLVGGLSLFLIFIQVASLGSARTWVDHTRTVIDTNQQLLRSVLEVEEGERGYLLTGDKLYLDPARKASAAIPGLETKLQGLVVDNPEQVARVRLLTTAVEARRDFIDKVIAVSQAQGPEAARAMVVAGRGSIVMADIRQRARDIDASETQLLNRRVNGARATQNLALIIGLTVAFLALLALTAGLILLARTNRRLNDAMAEASAAEAAREALGALAGAIFSNVPDYLIVLNVEGDDRYVVADINPAFAKAMNTTAERVRGRAINDIMQGPGGQRLIAHYRRVRAGGRPVTTRDEIPFPDGGAGVGIDHGPSASERRRRRAADRLGARHHL